MLIAIHSDAFLTRITANKRTIAERSVASKMPSVPKPATKEFTSLWLLPYYTWCVSPASMQQVLPCLLYPHAYIPQPV